MKGLGDSLKVSSDVGIVTRADTGRNFSQRLNSGLKSFPREYPGEIPGPSNFGHLNSDMKT